MRDKQYYRKKFKEYPDVVTLEQFREMLGGSRQLFYIDKIK